MDNRRAEWATTQLRPGTGSDSDSGGKPNAITAQRKGLTEIRRASDAGFQQADKHEEQLITDDERNRESTKDARQ